MKYATAISLVLALAIAGSAIAQDQTPPPERPAVITSTLKEFRELCGLLEGRWNSDILWINEWPGANAVRGETVRGHSKITRILDGAALEMKSMQGTEETAWRLYYHPATSQIRSLYLTSGGSPKVFPNDLTQSSGVLVFAVGHLVTDVGVCERYQNFGVHPGVVVAGKAPPLGVMESHETILTGLLGVCAEACDAGGRRDCRAKFLCQSLIKHGQRELIVVNLICDLARGSLERNIAGEKP